METDFLIIGQGLAGSLLAWALIQRGCKVVVVDTGKENASLVAVGIINPITGMRFAKTADVETLLPTAQNYYNQLSAYFGQQFYFDKPMLRIFRDQTELAHCKKRQHQADYAPYLGKLYTLDQSMTGFSTPFGFIEQRQTGNLLTVPLLTHMKQFFIERHSYRQDVVDYKAIQLGSIVHWQDITAKQVVFCEGYQASQNPWFSWLPFQPAKGEILTLEHQVELPDMILNYGNWLLPFESGKVRIGATFDRENINTQVSEQGKQTLLKTLKSYSPGMAQSRIVDHQAGIRPCTPDRLPFMGKHPRINQIAIFNGFGAKGSLQIPWYAQRFADYLLNHNPLPPSCDIQRFQTTHFTG
ncbi:FAD-binding oxidoreductase [Methyloglobulus sp.]|uniref:NAD(P)/FAD-dependent oxidoreductase n=1 Tax=Methyloglobulus sp. TaxID=2518622 RepID=UPI001810A5BD|nr:FAD-binding oxidoreductase [Methyloglobulus sp.]